MSRVFKSISFIAVAVLWYGFLFRPWLSTETLRDEVAVLEPGQMKTFDMNLPFERVVRLKYEVLEGGPVNVFLATMSSTQPTSRSIAHIPGFASLSTISGDTDALVKPGKWSIIVMPSKDAASTSTKVKVLTQIHRPRFFQRTQHTVILQPN